jgi:hypothetical protein
MGVVERVPVVPAAVEEGVVAESEWVVSQLL